LNTRLWIASSQAPRKDGRDMVWIASSQAPRKDEFCLWQNSSVLKTKDYQL